MKIKIFLTLTLILSPCLSYALVNFNSSASMGYYKDDQQHSHAPLIYSFSYNGLHSGGIETTLDLFLSNDFFQTQWSVVPAQASVMVPFSNGFFGAAHRVSRIQLGRQLFTEAFEINILDGIQAPIYWSKYGGIFLYGGNVRVLDLFDTTSAPLLGTSVFQEILGFKLKAGYGARQTAFSEQYIYGSIFKNFESIFLEPAVLSKIEWDLSLYSATQSFNELQLNLAQKLSLSLSHSLRKPRKLGSDQNQFIYYILSQSALETYQATAQSELTPSISIEAMSRMMRYNSGTQMQWAQQQEISLSLGLNQYNTLSPFFGHIQGYGGELWDTGLNLKSKLSDVVSINNEFSSAYLDKINNIIGWAYQVRSGLGYVLGPRWSSKIWVELERNHIFVFDARIVANVTYFN